MKREELHVAKTFMMISNWKNPLFSVGYTHISQRFKGLTVALFLYHRNDSSSGGSRNCQGGGGGRFKKKILHITGGASNL